MTAAGEERPTFDLTDLITSAERMPVPIVILDGDGVTYYANRLYCDLVKMDLQAVLERTTSDAVEIEDADVQLDPFFATRPGQVTGPYQVRTIRSDNSAFLGSWMVRRDEETSLYVSILLDITEEYEQHQELRKKATTDHLTGLLNRNGLASAVDDLQGDRDFSLAAIIDLDKFKMVNDFFGHAAGDRLLETISERLTAVVPADSLVGRMGGDEFVVLLQPDSPLLPKELGERLASVFDEPVTVQSLHLPVAASIGVTSGTARPDLDDLLREADAAAYEAKDRGGSRFVVANSAIVDVQRQKITMQRQIREAVGTGQFVPWYQPIVRLDDRTKVAYEVLVRWVRPGNDVVAASQFIDTAVESGLFSQMSAEARQIAAIEAAGWPDDIGLSLNLSAGELLAPKTTARLVEQLEPSGLDPERVMIEVSETVLSHHPESAARALRALAARGFVLALDNFGMEATSLTRLAQLPLTTVKLDVGLLTACRQDERGKNLLRGLIDMLTSMNLNIIAQGVETSEDHSHLRDVGVTYGQGWFYDPPAPAVGSAENRRATLLSLDSLT